MLLFSGFVLAETWLKGVRPLPLTLEYVSDIQLDARSEVDGSLDESVLVLEAATARECHTY